MDVRTWFDPNDYLLDEYQKVRLPVRSNMRLLDAMLGGGWSAGMWTVMAAPGTGKSAFGLHNMLWTAWAGVPCAFLSLEMGAAQCWHRLASAFSATAAAANFGVEPFKWSDVPKMAADTCKAMEERHVGIYDMRDDDMFVKATHAMTTTEVAGGRPFQLNIASGPGLHEIDVLLATIEEAVDAKGCGLVVVDYLQLISTDRGANRSEQLTNVSHAIAAKAEQLGVAVLTIASMNREGLRGGKPTMHDGNGTSAIEYDSTGIVTLVKVEDESTPEVRRIELEVQKNRMGTQGAKLLLDYRPAYNTFEEVRRSE